MASPGVYLASSGASLGVYLASSRHLWVCPGLPGVVGSGLTDGVRRALKWRKPMLKTKRALGTQHHVLPVGDDDEADGPRTLVVFFLNHAHSLLVMCGIDLARHRTCQRIERKQLALTRQTPHHQTKHHSNEITKV